jgi:cell division protease FtsH
MKKITPPRKSIAVYYLAVLGIMLLINWVVLPRLMMPNVTDVTYSDFLARLNANQVRSVELTPNALMFSASEQPRAEGEEKPKDLAIYRTGPLTDPAIVERLENAKVTFGAPVIQESSPFLNLLIGWLLPVALFVGLGQLLSRRMMQRMGGMNAMKLGKSNAKIYIESKTGITFADVAGQDEAKDALREIVDFLEHPDKYTRIGAVMPKGALLVGPPGTGKTLLAKAVAGEASVPFFSISGSEFVEMFVGMGAAKVRDLFKQAEEKAPCIVFIDEIDTIGKKRDGTGIGGGNDEREQTLNQLLSEMDGFDGRKGVVILAATNRPEVLDPALLRPGRFDRRIPVELPDLKGRIDILKVYIKKVKTEPGIDLSSVARVAVGASGAELANIINEAALRAVREDRQRVTQQDLEESVETVIAGQEKKSRILSENEKKIVAYHEVGHALVAAKQANSAPVHKITIIPRTGGALGFTMQVEEDERFLVTRAELENKIATLTGGRAAEELVFNTATTGAANDIEQATKIARAMITRFGMTEDFGFVAMETESSQYLGSIIGNCSSQTSARIDQLTIDLVKEQYARALQLLNENLDKLHELAQYLFERETITGEEFMAILDAPRALPDVSCAQPQTDN